MCVQFQHVYRKSAHAVASPWKAYNGPDNFTPDDACLQYNGLSYLRRVLSLRQRLPWTHECAIRISLAWKPLLTYRDERKFESD